MKSNAAQMVQSWQGYEASTALLAQAHAIASQSRGESSVAAANALYQLTQTQCLSGDFESAVATAKRAADIYRERLGAEDEKTKDADNLVAVITQGAAERAKDEQARAGRLARRLGLGTSRAAELLARNAASNTSSRTASVAPSAPARAPETDSQTGSLGHLGLAELVSYIEGGKPKMAKSKDGKSKSLVGRRRPL
jgi:protein TIF31